MKTIRFQQQVIRPISIFILLCLIVSNSGTAIASSEYDALGVSATITNLSLGPVTRLDSFLEELAKDTWFYLHSNPATDNHLPWSWHSGIPGGAGGSYANVTEIGFYALSWLAAYDLQRPWSPTWAATEAEVTAILNRLRAWQTGSQTHQPNGPNAFDHSVFYQWYWVSETPPVVGANADNNHVIPSIDNAFLAASLITIREYALANNHPTLTQKANAILNDMDFTLWYHYNTHRFSLGGVENPQGGGWADYFSNENRIINFVARALGQLNAEEFQLSLAALEKPSGSYGGITVERVAWDGSYFTYAGPALFIREMETLYGLNTITPATQAQIRYAKNQNYAVWGLSDTYAPGLDAYAEQGAPPAAMPGLTVNNCPPGVARNVYECIPGLVSPHASAMALVTPFAPQAIANLQKIANTFGCYHPSYGFRSSVMTKTGANYGRCSDRFYALEQEWIFLSLADYDNRFIWKYFYRDSGVVNAHTEMYGQLGRFKSIAAQDGWVLESGENSNQGGQVNATATRFVVGDNAANRQYRAILHFNTSSLPDTAVVSRVTLKIKKQGVSGTDPFTTHLKIAVDIRKGAFGVDALQPSDFQAASSRNAVGLIANTPQAGDWYIVKLNATAHPFINLAGVTQLRLRFQTDDDNDLIADYLGFYSGEVTPANRPVLVIEYSVP